MIGTTVGKYRILDRLGRGGMGIVYRALDETLDREVAIKVLNPEVADDELLKRFRVEAVSLARLNHPGIATIFELHRHEDDLLMVMEYVRGQTLQALSEAVGPFDPPHAAHICIQILDALTHAHRAGIIHRDLKPANVMVTESGHVKIMDFGIARMLGGESLTHAGLMMGTPAYMAPEQVLGQEVDGRADLYSVGVLFYRLLSRELPFQADNAITMAQKQVADEPTPIHTFRPNLPEWCGPVITRALAKNPEDRYQTAEAFRAAIRACVTPESFADLPTLATPTPLTLQRVRETTSHTGPSEAPTMTRLVQQTGASAAASTTAGPTTGSTPAVERTGTTTVVLTRGHLVSLAALLIVLLAGITALSIAAFKRTPVVQQQTTSTPEAAEPPLGNEANNPPAPAEGTAMPPAPGTQDGPASPPSAPPVSAPAAPAIAPPGPRTEKPVTASNAGATGSADRAADASATSGSVPAITLKDVRMLVQQGDAMREREILLTLSGDRLSLLDPDGEKEVLSLPYTALEQAFYSRSKQPKWKGPDGKEQSVSVDLGKLSFFRGERNWLILTTRDEPVFVRFEDAQLRTAMSAVQERTGLTIQR